MYLVYPSVCLVNISVHLYVCLGMFYSFDLYLFIFQQELEEAKKTASTSHPAMTPVIDAMEDALRSHCPRGRYLVDGSNSYVDVYNVSNE